MQPCLGPGHSPRSGVARWGARHSTAGECPCPCRARQSLGLARGRRRLCRNGSIRQSYRNRAGGVGNNSGAGKRGADRRFAIQHRELPETTSVARSRRQRAVAIDSGDILTGKKRNSPVLRLGEVSKPSAPGKQTQSPLKKQFVICHIKSLPREGFGVANGGATFPAANSVGIKMKIIKATD